MRHLLPLILLCYASLSATSQTCPFNLDFENGDFSNWQCSVGNTTSVDNKNAITLHDTTPAKGRHEIISAGADGVIPLDPYGKFPMVCPYGGKYSVKLGNDNAGAEAEGMSYTFTVPVTEDTFSFTYFYAVVLQNPNHPIDQQPRFFVTAYEVATGNVINCASYNYVATGGLPGFTTTDKDSTILFKNWSPSSIQFVNLGGKQVRLEFKTADCTQGAHFGYAYFDVGSGCSNILATAPYCVETNSLLLNAPYGFQYYTWYNENYTEVLGNSQNLTLNPPPAKAGRFYVDLNPYPGYGCRDTVYADVHPLSVPDLPAARTDYFYCQYETADILTATPSINSDLLWYTDTLQPALSKAPQPSTALPGVYNFYVSQKTLFGCESFKRKITVRVDPVPAVSFTVNQSRQCLGGNKFNFTSTSTNLQDSSFLWTFNDGAIDSVFASVTHTYQTHGDFSVSLKVRNGPVCYRETSNKISVVPKPLANYSFPQVICQNQTLLQLTDQSSVPQDISSLTAWYWQINGVASTLQNPTPMIPISSGDLPVSLVVATKEGCLSDTNRQVIKVHDQPEAVFFYDAPLCDNKTIHLADKSYLSPNATGENVNTWQWQFDANIVALQNPVYQFSEGIHHVILTVKSNFGCSSLPADSVFTIYPEPVIGININDSCVYRVIHYSMQDLAGNVTKWFWDFNNKIKEGEAIQTKSFNLAGDNSFTVYGQTAHGCMDTLQRPFMIYDNKAFAGNDTLAAYDQPVQLNAKGGNDNHYTWTPSLGLNNDTLENPLANSRTDLTYKLDAITNEGCDAHSKISIKRWNGPDIYIASAFTPNKDGINEVLHAKPVGMKQLGYFAVYDRFGNRVFFTTDFTQGWNGKIHDNEVPAGTYIAVAQATDYTGKLVLKKVAVVLIK